MSFVRCGPRERTLCGPRRHPSRIVRGGSSMHHGMSSGRLAEALSKAYLHWQTQPASAKATPPAFTIALSRQSGAGGGTIARAVGARLGWSVYDRELLQKIGDEMGLQATLLERVDEKRESWLGE